MACVYERDFAERGWRKRITERTVLAFIFENAPHVITDSHLSHFAHFSSNIFTCKYPLSPPIVPPDHNIKRNELSETRTGRSIQYHFFFFFRIITFFSLPFLHIISSPLLFFPSPTPILKLSSSERQITQRAALLAVLSVQ